MAGRQLDAQDALAAWLQHLAHERRCLPRTLEAYGAAGRSFLAFVERHRAERPTLAVLGDVKAAELRAYLAFRRGGERPLSPRSLSQTLSAVRSFYRWLDRRMGVANAEIALVRGPRVRAGVPRPVSPDAAKGLIGEAGGDLDREPWENARDAAVLTLLYGCGLRISEGLSLKRSDAPCPTPCGSPARAARPAWAPVLPAVTKAVDAYLAELPFGLGPDEALFRGKRAAPWARAMCRR